MGKKTWINGTYLTPGDMTNIVGYDANSGHLHTGLNQDGSVPKIDLTAHVAGPLNLLTQPLSYQNDSSVNVSFANKVVTGTMLPSGGNLSGTIGTSSDYFSTAYISNITTNGGIGPYANNQSSVGSPSAYYASSFVTAMYGTCFPPVNTLTIQGNATDFASGIPTATMRYEQYGNFMHILLTGSYSTSTSTAMRWNCSSGNFPFSPHLWSEIAPCFVYNNMVGGPAVGFYQQGGVSFTDASTLTFYTISGGAISTGFFGSNQKGFPYTAFVAPLA